MQPEDIIAYWYSERIRPQWFNASPTLDEEIRQHYEPIWRKACAGELDLWLQTASGSLALIIILDQFPLNMYRGKPESFQSEQQAVKVSLQAIDKAYDKELPREQLSFLFMPLMHSENMQHQNLAVEMYERHDLTQNLDFARHHREIIRKFARFPHRNAILDRESSDEEREYLSSQGAFKG